MTPNRVISPHVKRSLQTHHVDSTLKRRGNMESRWCVCRVILSGHFFNDGLIYMSSIVAPGKFLTLTFLSYFEILFSSKPDNIESPTMRVVFLLHFWRCSFELGDIWGFFYLFKFLLVFLTKLNKLVLDRNYWFFIYISMLLCFFIRKSYLLWVWLSVISLYASFSTVKLFLFCVWRRSPDVALIWTDWAFLVL